MTDEPTSNAMIAPIAWWRVVAAPWMGIARPRWAGRVVSRGPWWAVWGSFFVGLALIAGGIVLAALWLDTWQVVWPKSSASTVPAWQYATVTHRSLSDVWASWRCRPVNPAWMATGIASGLTITGALLMAWTLLPTILADRGIARSFVRSLRTVTSGVGLLALLAWGMAALFVVAEHTRLRRLTQSIPFSLGIWQILFIVGVPSCLCLLAGWLNRAALGARSDETEPDLPPRCEGCGYDLTHRPESGLCPECGLAVVESLGRRAEPFDETASPDLPPDRGERRIGCTWEHDGGSRAGWFNSSIAILRRPTRFYARLRLRSGEPMARRFARWHVLVIGLAAWAWVQIMALAALAMATSQGIGSPQAAELLYIPLSVGILASLCGHMLHGAVGALAMVSWAARDYLADVRWSRKIIAYEAAFLWMFCAYNGTAITTAMLLPFSVARGIESLLREILIVPAELTVFGFGNAALILLWLYRYRLAGRAVRWANF